MNQLTKDAIAKALTDLLQERPIEKITIKDITDRCGINRQTFYYHFSDIYNLMEWTLDKELRRALGTREISPTDWKEYVRKIFAVMRSQKRGLLNAYDEKNRLYYEVFLKKEIQPVVRQLVSECPEAEEVSKEKKTFIEEVYTRILLSFFLEWIDEGMQDETQVQLEDYFTLVDGSMNSALLRFKNAEK